MKSIISSLVWFLRRCFYNTPIKNWSLTAYLYGKMGRFLVGSSPFPVINYQGLKLKTNGEDVIITAALANGNYEPYTLAIFHALILEGLQTKTADPFVFADIGANIGIFTITAAAENPGIKVFAFEPNPLSYRLLQDNVELNGLKNVTPVNAAVGAKAGKVSLDISSPHAGFHSVYGRGSRRIEVPVLALDDFFSAQARAPRLYKADVEGYEPLVLRGMETLLRNGPLQIILEFNPEHLNRGEEAPKVFLRELTEQFDAIFCLDEIERSPLRYRPGNLPLERKILSVGYNLLLIKGGIPKCLG
ncbi:MAG: FkbM family methyltransferase [Methylacidiphilales bacterium]|nr:FkbM family methyltransferase [Candidatus Methylacidiphilales bacterium]